MLHVLSLQSEPINNGPKSTAAGAPRWTGKTRRWHHRTKRCRKISLLPKRETEELDSNDCEISENHVVASNNRQRSISECYFAVKGAALVLPQNECIHLYKKPSTNGGDIQQHLQSMFYLLRPEDTLKMAVKLESIHGGRMRYLVVVSCVGKEDSEESCLLGVDCNGQTTIGLVLPVWADTRITLDGDGGFSVSSSQRHHIFKPVSVQAMWSALQTLHKASAKARECHYFMGGLTHSWIEYYEKKVESDRSCLNEWFAMDNLESRRPPSPDCLRSRPMEREITEQDIRVKLKEIMMTVDLDEVTSKYIRTRLEEDLDMDLHEYKSFIDQEMITILGQMDAATEILDHLYLGSEWNASNLEELKKNGVGHILNVTREIDNFFPGMFEYLNVRVYDEEGTELLKHWDTTYKFITGAKEKGSKVLVHCKMGVSRSASVVIAYAMKAHNWNMQTALQFVKNKRTCVKPNVGFMKQLEIYQGILDASRHRHNTLWRSKSENNLNSQPPAEEAAWQEAVHLATVAAAAAASSSSSIASTVNAQTEEPKILPDNLSLEVLTPNHRPKSWSPDDNVADMLFPGASPDTEVDGVEKSKTLNSVAGGGKHGKHVLLPCGDGKTYSVSPNKALHIAMPLIHPVDASSVKFQVGSGEVESPVYECRYPLFEDIVEVLDEKLPMDVLAPLAVSGVAVHRVSSIKDRINELESQAMQVCEQRPVGIRLDIPENKGLVLNLANQFESGTKSNPSSPVEESPMAEMASTGGPILSQTKPPVARHQAVLIRPETWVDENAECGAERDNVISLATITDIKTDSEVVGKAPTDIANEENPKLSANIHLRQSAVLSTSPPNQQSPPVVTKINDPFSTQLDRVFDKEERRNSSGMRHDSWGSSDSAICMMMPVAPHRESPSRQSSWSSSDSRSTVLSRECSWGSADVKRPFPCGPTITEGLRKVFGPADAVVIRTTTEDVDDQSLKRTSSFDGALPLHIAREDASVGSRMAVIETVKSGVIQRSQSLRQNNTIKLRDEKKLPIPNPQSKHFRSPSDKRASFRAIDNREAPSATASKRRSPTSVHHYASAPILYKSGGDGVRVPVLHSSSQPNLPCASLIHHSASTTAVPTMKSESTNSKLESKMDEVPSYGIVKQHKETLENFIISMPANRTLGFLSGSPPSILPPCMNVSSDNPPMPSDEWKKVQHRLQFADPSDAKGIAATQPQQQPPPPPPSEAEDLPGVVRRIRREMEAKGVVTAKNTRSAAVAVAVPNEAPPKADKLIIFDQQGKEVSLPTPDVVSVTPSTIRVPTSSSVSPLEDKSVRSLVGKFEVPKDQQTERQRYFSETEVANMPWTPELSKTNRKSSIEYNGSCPLVTGKGTVVLPISEQEQQQLTMSSNVNNGANKMTCRPPAGHSRVSELSTVQQQQPPLVIQKKMKKAHGRTHPLSRLPSCCKPRNANSLYNTM